MIAKILGVTPGYFYEGYQDNKKESYPLPIQGDIIKGGTKQLWNILLVEDNPEDEFLFRKIFEKMPVACNFNIHNCYDGVEAVQYLRSSNTKNIPLPDIIFIDLNLPKKDGFTLLKDLKRDSMLSYIPTIVLTNSVNAEEMLNCYKLQASGYVCKSFDINAFQKKIESVLSYWTNAVANTEKLLKINYILVCFFRQI